MTHNMADDLAKVLLTREELEAICKRLGAQISKDYENSENLVMLCILKGSTPFFADLAREITVPCEYEFMRVSSYCGTESTRTLKIRLDMDRDDISKCDIVVVEDIIDSGNTLLGLKAHLAKKGARSVKLCALLDKPDRREVDLVTDYTGAVIPDEFVVGYGLDYNETYRNLPYIGVLKREVYEK